MRQLRSIALAALLAAAPAAAPLLAQEEPAPQFHLERIVVEGLERQAAREIVLAESRLHAGRSYSEPQLREAVHRINRLPFVVHADMSLRRGSARGDYELVIAVEGARPLFYGVDIVTGYAGEAREFRLALERDTLATVGARKFVGARGVLFGSLQTPESYSSGDPVVVGQAGYTRYGLFRGGGYGTVAVAAGLGGDRGNEELQGSLQAGIPLTGNHALRGGLAYTRTERANAYFLGPTETSEDAWGAELAWIYDSTDDPLAPSAGSRFTLAGEYTERRHDVLAAPPVEGFADFAVDEWLLRLEGRRYRPLGARQAIGLGGYAWYTSETIRHASPDSVEELLGLEAIHAVDLRGPAASRRKGDLRLESGLGVQRLEDDDARGRSDHVNALARVSLLFRDAWGLVRVSLVYVEEVGGSR